MTIVLGVTGGIATGKSTVTAIFRSYGIPVVDGDEVAREVVQPQTEGLKRITTLFGREVLKQDGTLNRKKLGKWVFSDPEKRKQLDEALDQLIRAEIERQRDAYIAQELSLVVLDIPLLFESHYEKEVDQVMVVYVPEDVQLQRLVARDKLTKAEAQKRINSQLSIELKKERADILVENSGSKEETEKIIKEWLQDGF